MGKSFGGLKKKLYLCTQKSRGSPKIIKQQKKKERVMEVKIMGILSLVPNKKDEEFRPLIEKAKLSELESQDEFVDTWIDNEDTEKDEKEFLLHAKDKGYSVYGYKEDWQVVALVAIDE